MIIYCTTCLVNGKKYIGKDEHNNPNYLGSGLLFSRALKQYGKENFIKEILAYGIDKKDLRELEKYYIDYYNAQKSDLFYNIAPGGDGGTLCLNYNYREIPIVEIDKDTYKVVKEYKSAKEAAKLNGLNYKVLNGVVNGTKRFVSGRVFKKKADIHNILNLIVPIDTRIIYLSLITGIYYFSLKEIWNSEYNKKHSFPIFHAKLNGFSSYEKEIFPIEQFKFLE